VGWTFIPASGESGVTTVIHGSAILLDEYSSSGESFSWCGHSLPISRKWPPWEKDTIEPDQESLSDARWQSRSFFSSDLQGFPSLESVGITSEEWVTRGWNVFFGAWGVG